MQPASNPRRSHSPIWYENQPCTFICSFLCQIRYTTLHIVHPSAHAFYSKLYTLTGQIWLLYPIELHKISSLHVLYDIVEVYVALKGIWLSASSFSTDFSKGVELLSESSFPCWDSHTFTGCAASATSCFALLADRLMPICTKSIGVVVTEHDLTLNYSSSHMRSYSDTKTA